MTQYRLAALCLVLLAGCSSFERDWKTAHQYAYPCHDISGIWVGTWHSDYNGHEGKLRAIITKQSENCYYAQFKASYAVVIPFQFELPITATRNGEVYSTSAQADLGWLAGGVFTYNGESTPCEFVANFCSKRDYGTFRMTRIWTCNQCYLEEGEEQPMEEASPPHPAPATAAEE